MSIRALVEHDWSAVCAIYAEGIATGDATFETAIPVWEQWDTAHLRAHRLVALIDGQVRGWAALAPVSDRCAYAGVPAPRRLARRDPARAACALKLSTRGP